MSPRHNLESRPVYITPGMEASAGNKIPRRVPGYFTFVEAEFFHDVSDSLSAEVACGCSSL